MIPAATDGVAAHIKLLPTAEAVAQRAAAALAGAVETGIHGRGWGSLALSGGSTPVPTFHQLRRYDLDWSQVCVTLVDERWVEPSSLESNQRLLVEHFLTGGPRRAHFVPMKNQARSPMEGVTRHVQALRTVPMPLDAVLLGMGEDGHFASLFPRSSALTAGLDPQNAMDCLAVPAGADGQAPAQPRMSLTLSAIARARRVVLITSGSRKLDVLAAAVESSCDPADKPIAALLAARPDILLLHSLH